MRWPGDIRAYLLIAAGAVAMCGCASVPERHPVPEALTERAVVPANPRARTWGDQRPVYADAWLDAPPPR